MGGRIRTAGNKRYRFAKTGTKSFRRRWRNILRTWLKIRESTSPRWMENAAARTVRPHGCGPFQLLNFTGTQRDVATLAHESGHGVHFILSYKQGILQYHPPLTLAETASIFGEMIVFRDLLERAPSDQDRLQMIMGKCVRGKSARKT